MAAVYDERYDWDHLSDEDWNKRLDEKVEEFNRGRGEVVLPPPSFAIMDDEYVRGINYKYVTEDLIRHFADAIGDPSPFWRDPTYIQSTRWGGFIAPPLFETCIAFGSSFGGRLRVPGIARLAGGSKHIYKQPIRPGDSFTIYDKYEGFVEKQVKDKPYRMFIESAPRYYINQRDEVAAIEVHRNIYMATPPGKRGKKKEAKMYQDKVRKPYSDEVIDMIHAGITNVGKKPTIEGENPAGVETYLFDFDGNLYGREIRVEFLKFMRPESRFSSIEELKEQLNRDIQGARAYFEQERIRNGQ